MHESFTIPSHVAYVDLQAQYRSIEPEIHAAINGVLQQSDFILGQALTEFEDAFARYCAAEFAIGVDSGYSALELILRGYEIGPGDEVITAANTFIATALAISNCGAKPVLVDVDPASYTLDPQQVADAITPATRAIMPVHLYGHPADMEPIRQIAQRRKLRVIEDAAQAHGAEYRGQRTGSLGDAAGFSFYPGKNLGAYGDGGAVVTHDPDLAERVRLLRHMGQTVKYHHQIKGYNRRLDTLQAAILSVKLAKLDEWNARRRQRAAAYTDALSDIVITPQNADWATPVYHLYVIRTAARDRLLEHLAQADIAAGMHYPIPIHLQPAYRELGYQRGDFPVTEQLASEILSLPICAELTDEDLQRVTHTVRHFLAQTGATAEPGLVPAYA